jgi:hypothetical protein
VQPFSFSCNPHSVLSSQTLCELLDVGMEANLPRKETESKQRKKRSSSCKLTVAMILHRNLCRCLVDTDKPCTLD